MKNPNSPLNQSQINFLRSKALNIIKALESSEKEMDSRSDTLDAIKNSLDSLNEALPKIEFGLFLE